MTLFDVTTAEGSGRVCYVLLPEGVMTDMAKWAGEASAAFSTNIVLVSGLDWNRDMSPWPADGVMKARKNFAGGGRSFLEKLTNDYMPAVEQWLNLEDPSRYLLGISLSGLFALWSLSKYDGFRGVASVSGSLWFDGFVEWMSRTPFSGSAEIYLSLGVREKDVRDARMSKVEDATKEIASLLGGKGYDVTFEMVPGTHFSPAAPKFDRALGILLGTREKLLVPER